MTEHLPQEEKVVNQTNSGPGTFVGGNVFGHIYNFFAPAQRQRPSSTPAGQDSRAVGEGDYDDVFGSLLGAVFLGGTFAGGLVYAARGLPFAKDAPAPDVLERLVMGFMFGFAFFACVAAFLARAAQGFELWAEQCANITAQTQIRLLSYLPSGMTRALAVMASVTATTAALLAVFYAWGGFGASIQERANLARDKAALQAARARAATQR
ncbi:hypothetical protein OOK43_32070 [[Kitasatospora] papulosa]|uniref:hypothetical protein n=1 Tax=Streptomyces TaxID=1883 RepID=UPI002250557E|nr:MULTISPECIES: hypothetical protein [Streptomyces]MCX4417875.1 hypothetical protein [[Kitasatospora] papulosa]MCY1649374.1 hypothetical protein [Streptomyces sp. SL203]MCY1677086.1 hypothetical protein [Streptomyces sp. SL294]